MIWFARRPLFRSLARLRRERSGSVLPVAAIGLTVLIGSVGFAIDVGRFFLVRSELQNASDAAGLSAMARASSSADTIRADVRRFVEANLAGSGTAARLVDVSVTPVNGGDAIQVVSTLEVDSAFLGLLGMKTFATSASTRIERRQEGSMDVALVLDVTTSMGTADMRAMKAGALNLVSVLYGDSRDSANLRMSVVPFNTGVNIGVRYARWLKPESFQRADTWGRRAWTGCVRARPGELDLLDRMPREDTRFRINEADRWRLFFDRPINDHNDDCHDSPVLPLTSDRGRIEDSINGLGRSGKGLTHVDQGAIWGWRTLSQEWQDFWWTSTSSSVTPVASPGAQKVMVLMTDGENVHTASTSVAYPWVENNRKGSFDGRLNNVERSNAEEEMNRNLSRACESAKRAGVTVYTIAYGREIASGSGGRAIRALLLGCASKDDYFFAAPDPASLEEVFAKVSLATSALRISR